MVQSLEEGTANLVLRKERFEELCDLEAAIDFDKDYAACKKRVEECKLLAEMNAPLVFA